MVEPCHECRHRSRAPSRRCARPRRGPDSVIDGSLILQGVISSAAIIELNEDIVTAARNVAPVHVGALDAIHIASALSLDQELAGIATYDNRMSDSLTQMGVEVIAPRV